MSESFYFTDEEISQNVFHGEPVPDENTVDSATNLQLKRSVRDFINGLFGTTTMLTDTYNLLKQYGYILYKRLLDDDKAVPIKKDDQFMISMIVRRYSLPALYIGNMNT